MATRSQRQNAIVQTMIEDALVSANEFERECIAFAERQKMKELGDVIGELGVWLDERESAWLARLGIEMLENEEGELAFGSPRHSRPFRVSTGANDTIIAGGRLVRLDRDLPVLDEDVYDEVLSRLLDWAATGRHGQA